MKRRAVVTQRRIDGRWQNVLEGSFRTQEQAAKAGMDAARDLGCEWYRRGLLGRFVQRNSYGGDSRRRPG